MQQIESQTTILLRILRQNSNPLGYKQVIESKVKEIELRTYWYFTSGQAQFLTQIYEKKLERQILKKRIQMITDEKMNELIQEILDDKIKKKSQKEDELDINLSIIANNMDKNSQDTRQRVREISEDFKQFKTRIQSIKRQQHQKSLERQAIQDQIKRSLQKQKKNQFKQQLRSSVQQLQQKQRERRQSHERFKIFLAEFKKQKPRHQLMEELYKQKFELPALEESRQKLEQRQKQRKKPTLQELNEHDRLYLKRKQQNPVKQFVQHQTIDVFKSHFYSRQKETFEQGKGQENQIVEQYEKVKRYSLFVKEHKRPQISQKLKHSLQEMKTPVPILQSPDRSKVIQVGKNYLQFMHKLQKQPRSETPAETPVTQSRYLNYLQELKSKSEHGNTISHDWDRMLRNRSAIQKREEVLIKSKQLEQKAMRDEKFVSHFNFGKAQDIIDKKKQIDETLLSSIKAKVALLKTVHHQ